MIEAEWLACTDPREMLKSLGDNTSDRVLRLFACACCRRIWPLLSDARSRQAVEVVERYAEGLAGEEELAAARAAANVAAQAAAAEIAQADLHWADDSSLADSYAAIRAAREAADAACFLVADVAEPALAAARAARAAGFDAKAASLATGYEPGPEVAYQTAQAAEADAQADLLRCIFGNPFHLVSLDPGWLTWNGGTVAKLAQAIYEERRFQDLPVLADALEEAGCTNEGILVHCRRPGEHVRGCWVVDLLLGKE
jgi:hypothetical protein